VTTLDVEQLYAELYSGAMRNMWRHHSLQHADREDVLLASFVELIRTMERGYVGDPGALLHTIANRRAIDAVRANVTRLNLEIPVGGTAELGWVEENQSRFLNRMPFFEGDFDQAVRDLPEEERDAYILTELRGLSQVAAADVLGVSQPTMSRRLDAARDFIREEIS